MLEHLSTSEDVATLKVPYDQVQPLEIPYDLSQMTISMDLVVHLTIIVEEPLAIKEPIGNIIGLGE